MPRAKLNRIYNCECCQCEFTPRRPGRRFCSTGCAAKYNHAKRMHLDTASSYDLTMLEKSLVELQERMEAERQAERERVTRRAASMAEAEPRFCA